MTAQRRTRSVSLWADVARAATRAAEAGIDRSRAMSRYVDDPVAYAHDVLGIRTWEGQDEILEALAKGDRVTVRSGHGIGKSVAGAAVSHWFRSTRGPGCRVIMTGPTSTHVNEVLWSEYRRLARGSRIPLGGEIAKLARSGHRDPDQRQVFGLTADTPEGFAGIRASEMLIVVDEASGVDGIWETIEGNLSGGGKLLLLGNPTHAEGYFFESHNSDAFARLHIPSTRSPNVVAGEIVFPGLCTRDFVEARANEWGETSPDYRIRVLGEFVEGLEGRIFDAAMIAAAEQRWHTTLGVGPLVIGIDPAGQSGLGDESVFVARRGNKVLRITARLGLTPEGHLIEALGMIRELGATGERPTLCVDRDGLVGAKVFAVLSAFASTHESELNVWGVRGGERARRRPMDVDRIRDEVWFSCVDWMRDGGAIPEDLKLVRDLAALRFEKHVSGRSKVSNKDDLRKALGRSPDRGDALALACWPRESQIVAVEAMHTATSPDHDVASTVDPYAGSYSSPFDPYSGAYGGGSDDPYSR